MTDPGVLLVRDVAAEIDEHPEPAAIHCPDAEVMPQPIE